MYVTIFSHICKNKQEWTKAIFNPTLKTQWTDSPVTNQGQQQVLRDNHIYRSNIYWYFPTRTGLSRWISIAVGWFLFLFCKSLCFSDDKRNYSVNAVITVLQCPCFEKCWFKSITRALWFVCVLPVPGPRLCPALTSAVIFSRKRPTQGKGNTSALSIWKHTLVTMSFLQERRGQRKRRWEAENVVCFVVCIMALECLMHLLAKIQQSYCDNFHRGSLDLSEAFPLPLWMSLSFDRDDLSAVSFPVLCKMGISTCSREWYFPSSGTVLAPGIMRLLMSGLKHHSCVMYIVDITSRCAARQVQLKKYYTSPSVPKDRYSQR